MVQNRGWLLGAGEYLRVGDWLTIYDRNSNNGYAAVLRGNGDLVVCYANPDATPDLSKPYYSFVNDAGASHLVNPGWRLDPAQTGGQYIAAIQGDGNFVLYPGTDPAHIGTPYWSANTQQQQPTGKYCLTLGIDGNVRVANCDAATAQGRINNPGLLPALWQTGLWFPSQRVTQGSCLRTGQWLGDGSFLVSGNGRYGAVLQHDGNWVLCPAGGSPPVPDLSRPYWSAFGEGAGGGHTVGGHGQPPFVAAMQDDGNFVLYNGYRPDPRNSPYWSARTEQPQPVRSVAVLRDDGSFAVLPGDDPASIVAPRWATATVTDPTAVICRVVSGADQKVTTNSGHLWAKYPEPIVVKVTYQSLVPVPGAAVRISLWSATENSDFTLADPATSPVVDYLRTTTDSNGIARVNDLWGKYWLGGDQPPASGGFQVNVDATPGVHGEAKTEFFEWVQLRS
jgi:hypothetical protein